MEKQPLPQKLTPDEAKEQSFVGEKNTTQFNPAPLQAAERPSFPPRKGKIGVRVVGRPDSLSQRVYLPAVLKGLGVTMRHFFANLFSRKYTVTVQYPEQKVQYPERFRGLHRLMHREDGGVRCVACMLCPTACPAHCITIVAEDTGNGVEKRPKIFEIDELRCVVCGLCVEACPCDAIRMDTGVHASAVDFRGDAILGKVDLMKRGTLSTATQGGVGGEWRDSPQPEKQGSEINKPY